MKHLPTILIILLFGAPAVAQAPPCASLTNPKTGTRATVHPEYGCLADPVCAGACKLIITDRAGNILKTLQGSLRPSWSQPLEWLDETHLLVRVTNIGQWSNVGAIVLYSFDPWTGSEKTLFLVDYTCQTGCYGDRHGLVAVVAGKMYYIERSTDKSLSIYLVTSKAALEKLSDRFLLLRTAKNFPEFELVPNHRNLIFDIKGKRIRLDEGRGVLTPE